MYIFFLKHRFQGPARDSAYPETQIDHRLGQSRQEDTLISRRPYSLFQSQVFLYPWLFPRKQVESSPKSAHCTLPGPAASVPRPCAFKAVATPGGGSRGSRSPSSGRRGTCCGPRSNACPDLLTFARAWRLEFRRNSQKPAWGPGAGHLLPSLFGGPPGPGTPNTCPPSPHTSPINTLDGTQVQSLFEGCLWVTHT